jgi:Ca2+-binding EF-hand superfamily protein
LGTTVRIKRKDLPGYDDGAEIVRKHPEGTYDVRYRTGTIEKDVAAVRIALPLEVSSSQGESKEAEPSVQYRMGQKVEAKWKKGAKFYPGRIMSVNANGSLDIKYDDGEEEKGVLPIYVKPLDTSPRASTASTTYPDSDAEGDPRYRVGEYVEARQGGNIRWVIATVVSFDRSEGTYHLRYSDGQEERRVKYKLIRRSTAGASREEGTARRLNESEAGKPKLSDGDKVEGNYRGRGKWYPGKISRDRGDGTYDVDYDDGEKETRVDKDLIRVFDVPARGRDRTPSPKPSSRHREPDFGRGDKVEARPRGSTRWLSAEVTRAHSDNTFDLEFDDGERESGVPSDRVRRRESSGRDTFSRRDEEEKDDSRHDVKGAATRLLSARSVEAIRSMCTTFQSASTEKTCRKVFEEADEATPTGSLSKKEFKSALRVLYSSTYESSRSMRSSRDRAPTSFEDWLADGELQNLLDGLAYSKNGTIVYDDFLLFSLEPASGDSEELVELHAKMSKEVWLRSKLRSKDLLKYFSSSRTASQGYVRVSEFDKVVRKIFPKASTKDVELLVARFDPSKDGTMDFNEFITWLSAGRVPEESKQKWGHQVALLEPRAVEGALLKNSSGSKGEGDSISGKGLEDAAKGLGLCLGSGDLRAIYSSLDPEDRGKVTVDQVMDLTGSGRGRGKDDADGGRTTRKRLDKDSDTAGLLGRALRDDVADAVKAFLKEDEKSLSQLVGEQVTDSTRSTSTSGSGNVCLSKKHFRKVLSKLSCQMREDDEGLLFESLDFEGKGSAAADDVLLFFLGLAFDNDSLEAADMMRDTLIKKKVPAKEVLRQLGRSSGRKDDTGYVEHTVVEKVLRKLSGGTNAISDDQMSDLMRFVDPEKHGLVDYGYVAALCLVAGDTPRAEAKVKNALRIMRLRSLPYKDILLDDAREDDGRSMSVDALVEALESKLALPLTRCELQLVAAKYQKRGRINVEALCEALESESDREKSSRGKLAAGKDKEEGIGRSMFRKLCKLRGSTTKAAVEQLNELRQGILELDRDLVGRISRRELQRMLDRYADLSDEEASLLEENLGFPDGIHSQSVDYPLLLLVLSEPIVGIAGAGSPVAAGVGLMKKMMRGSDSVGLRRLLDLLFRNLAASDAQAKGVVTFERAAKVLLEEAPSLDATILDNFLSSFLDKGSDCVKYPEMLSFLACCSNWSALQRLNQLDLARQKQGYHFKEFLLKNFKKSGKKLDSVKFADLLLGLGILMPDAALVTVFANYADKATKALNVEMLVAALEDASGTDPDEAAKKRRNDVPVFGAGKEGKCQISQQLLKKYDERVTRAVQLAFDSFDKNNTNELPDTDLERVLCSLGFSATVDEMDELLSKIDRRNSGVLEYNDFMSHIIPFIRSKYSEAATKSLETFKTYFSALDINGDGTLTHAEFSHAVQSAAFALTDAEVMALIDYLDVDNDNAVSFAEFSLLFTLVQNEDAIGSSAEINALPHDVRSALRKVQYSSMPNPEKFLTMFSGLPSSFRQSVLAEQDKKASSHVEDIVRLGGVHVSVTTDPVAASEEGLALSVKLNQMQFEVQVVRVTGVPSESDARSPDVLHRCEISKYLFLFFYRPTLPPFPHGSHHLHPHNHKTEARGSLSVRRTSPLKATTWATRPSSSAT